MDQKFINHIAVMRLFYSVGVNALGLFMRTGLVVTLHALFPQIRFATRSAMLCWTLI